MSTVVAQPYSTAGNGGRKLVRLSNGWLIVAVKTTDYFYFYVSKDNGGTWEQLCYIYESNINEGDIAIAATGTRIFAVFIYNNIGIYPLTFDATNVSNENIYKLRTSAVDVSQTAIGNVSLALNPQGTELHVAWVSTNSTYYKALNIRYKKGKINNDGSIVWNLTEQITNLNVTTHRMYFPSVVVNSSGEAVIICDEHADSGLGNVIVAFSKSIPFANSHMTNATEGWGNRLIYNGMTNNQSNPSAVVDKNGRIWVAWQSNDGQYLKVRVSYSDDGGITWSAAQQVDNTTNTQTTPSLSVDKNNDLFISWAEVSPSYLIYGIKSSKYVAGTWEVPSDVALQYPIQKIAPSVLYDTTFNATFGQVPPLIYKNGTTSVEFVGTYTTNNAPTLTTTSPVANQTFHENGILTMAGNASDLDIDDVVTVKYQIDSGTVRNLHSAVSDGSTPIDFSRALTYKDGVLKDGATNVTSVLDKDVPHTVSIWAEDGKGGKSSIITRTFFVVPNRPPGLTIQPIAAQSELINSNIINVVGTVTDLDNNDVRATFSINGAEEQVIFEGAARNFTFNILLNDLKVGANTIIVKVVDTYNAVTTKTLTINKTHNATPINEAVALYKISAPTGTAKSILLWITRTLGPLQITPEISFVNAGEPENFVPLELTNSGTVNGLKQDEYAYQGAEEKANIVLKITYNRNDVASLDAIKQISGVLF